MNNSLSRRDFLRQAAFAALAASCCAPGFARAQESDTLRHAAIGVGGQGGSDLEIITSHPFVKLVAVADVEADRAARWKKEVPDLRVYTDWRELLDKEKELDSINVATPDHMHAPVAMTALQRGLHVYCQKPLTHDVYESRQLREFAAKTKLATQMGIQIHSSTEYRLAVRLIQDGAVGKIKEVHSFCNKKWGDPAPRPDRSDPVPAGFDWNLWLGVAAPRPFIGGGYYHPSNWRKRLDFGTGTFGDMGCHIYDPVFKALELTAPLSLLSTGPKPGPWNWPIDAKIEYLFPGTAFTAGKSVKVTWYDGDQRPPREVEALIGGSPMPGCGSVFIGEKGVVLLPHIGRPQLLPHEQFKDYPVPKVSAINHYTQFLEAARGNGRCSASVAYGGPLTETVLLGGVATRFPNTTLLWNAAKLKFTNESKANEYIKRPYRDGWRVKGLA
jgi:predicted dehydrogenase